MKAKVWRIIVGLAALGTLLYTVGAPRPMGN